MKAYKMQNHLLKVALVKNYSENFHKFHRKEPLMKSFLSYVVACDFTEKELHQFLTLLTLFRILFWLLTDGREQKTPLSKICHTYPTMMKLGTAISYLKKLQKYMNHVTHPFSSADISMFSPENSKFCYINKYRYRYHFGK